MKNLAIELSDVIIFYLDFHFIDFLGNNADYIFLLICSSLTVVFLTAGAIHDNLSVSRNNVRSSLMEFHIGRSYNAETVCDGRLGAR